MQQRTQRLAIIFIPLGILLLIILVVSALIGNSTPPHAPQSNLGNADSGENVGPAIRSSLLGYDSLFDYGVTTDQVDALQTALRKYTPFSKTNSTVEILGDTVVAYAPDPHDPKYYPSIICSVVVNQKTIYRIKFYYWGTSSVELLLYDRTQQTKLFDSGTVNSSGSL